MLTDAEFLEAFEAGTLSPFHHRDHLRMAWLYLRQEPSAAETRILDGLRRFADTQGASGLFHATLTRFWVRLVRHVAEAGGATTFDDLFAIFPRLTDTSLPERHFRRETLWSPAARHSWVEPDVLPMP
jgi:hypothetical protein